MTREENKAFATRLKAALRAAGIEPRASELEKRFNSRYRGPAVTSQAVSGWLTGKSMPKPDRIRVLGELVGIDPQALHYGDKKVAEPKVDWPVGAGPRERHVIAAFLALPAKKRDLVGELVVVLGEGGDS